MLKNSFSIKSDDFNIENNNPQLFGSITETINVIHNSIVRN